MMADKRPVRLPITGGMVSEATELARDKLLDACNLFWAGDNLRAMALLRDVRYIVSDLEKDIWDTEFPCSGM